MPAELYFVAREPVALVGMAFPTRVDWAELAAQGVGHVMCLTHADAAPYDASPLSVTAIHLEDQFAREAPSDPERERERVLSAARVVVAQLLAGVGVAVHCRGGRGRAGSVMGCALVMLGHHPDDVVTHLDRIHTQRGKGGWPEVPWQAEVVRTCPRPS